MKKVLNGNLQYRVDIIHHDLLNYFYIFIFFHNYQ